MGRRLARHRRLGRGVRVARSPVPRTTRRATRSGRSCSRSSSDKHEADEDVSEDLIRRSLAQNDELVDAFGRAWPLIDPTDLVGDLWSVPAYLRRCAPWLDPDEVRLLQRAGRRRPGPCSDLPLLDAARQRLGDPEASAAPAPATAAAAAEREEMSRVVDHLIATDDSDMQVMSMLRVHDLQNALVDEDALRRSTRTCSPARSRTSWSTRPRS